MKQTAPFDPPRPTPPHRPQFYFLKPTHSMFGFFTALADAYSAVMMPPKDIAARLQADVDDMCAR